MVHDLNRDNLRVLIRWHAEYRPEWDDMPDEYETRGVVSWGRSRRLGLLRLGEVKAYLGVQHVDPAAPGWGLLDEPQARFFLSLFVDGRVVALRTFPSMDAALEELASFLRAAARQDPPL